MVQFFPTTCPQALQVRSGLPTLFSLRPPQRFPNRRPATLFEIKCAAAILSPFLREHFASRTRLPQLSSESPGFFLTETVAANATQTTFQYQATCARAHEVRASALPANPPPPTSRPRPPPAHADNPPPGPPRPRTTPPAPPRPQARRPPARKPPRPRTDGTPPMPPIAHQQTTPPPPPPRPRPPPPRPPPRPAPPRTVRIAPAPPAPAKRISTTCAPPMPPPPPPPPQAPPGPSSSHVGPRTESSVSLPERLHRSNQTNPTTVLRRSFVKPQVRFGPTKTFGVRLADASLSSRQTEPHDPFSADASSKPRAPARTKFGVRLCPTPPIGLSNVLLRIVPPMLRQAECARARQVRCPPCPMPPIAPARQIPRNRAPPTFRQATCARTHGRCPPSPDASRSSLPNVFPRLVLRRCDVKPMRPRAYEGRHPPNARCLP